MNPSLRVVGAGRAGGAVMRALGERGWTVHPALGRPDDLSDAAAGVDVLLIATPDGAIEEAAAAVRPVPDTVVMHLAGSLGLAPLGEHPRRAALHPLMALPDADTGAQRLVGGGWFAVAGDPMAARMAEDLGGRTFVVAEEHRAGYHAAAVVASNHLVALLGQVERLADAVDVPFEAFLPLIRGTVDNVAELGSIAALTGPAARGDQETIDRHLAAIAPDERILYETLVEAARRLAQ